MIKKLYLIVLTLSSLSILQAQNYSISSPDGKAVFQLYCTPSTLSYSLSWEKESIADKSEIQFFQTSSYKVLGKESKKINASWKPVWGQSSTVEDRCNELTLHLAINNIKTDLICRVYDDGIGIRFAVAGQNNLKGKKIDFRLDLNTASSAKAYHIKGQNVLGPLAINELFSGEGKKTKIQPLVLEYHEGRHVSLLESDLYTAKLFRTAIIAKPSTASLSLQSPLVSLTNDNGFVSPWKVILFEKTVGDLVTNNVPINLAAPCKLKNTQWIKAGKGLWDWRVHGYDNGDFKYGIDTKSYLRYIDFCSEYNIDYFTIDDHWFKSAKDGKMDISPEVDIKKVMDYAKSKNVKIILYYDRKKGDYGDDKLFAFYRSLASVGMKYGFMGNNTAFTRNAIDEAAKENLLIFFHDGPVPMTGVYRTMPNMVSREYCHGQQDGRRAFTPSTFIKMALVNAISGPLDQSNGNFGINSINSGIREKGPRKTNSYNATVVSEVARTLVIFSGLVTLPDAPEEYRKKSDLFQFLKEMPATWDESKVIQSKMGEYIATARRSGDTWFVGTVNNENKKTLDLALDFLDSKKKYEATIFEDAADAHGLENPEVYKIKKQKVNAKTSIKASMAVGGGHAMIIKALR